MANWLRYSNMGATRNQPLSPQLVNALSFLGNMGVTMDVFSGGQDPSGPHHTGSHRHDFGNAGDVMFYKDGRPLSWQNPGDVPLFQQIVQQAKARGVTGFGAGEGYMRPGSMHIGFGTPAVWGAGGRGANAPGWLRGAGGGAAGAAPAATAVAAAAPPNLAMHFGQTAATGGGAGLGDVVAQQGVQGAMMPPAMPNIAFNLIQQAEERRQREQEDEQARREALFAPTIPVGPGSSLASLYG